MNIQKQLRVGIVGAGHFGRFHALKSASNPSEHLIALYDPDIKRAQSVAHEVKCSIASDYQSLLKHVDAIIIAAPAEFHFTLASEALQAGKHVLVEKPISATLDEAYQLAKIAKETNQVLQVGHLLRYSAEHKAITERVKRPLYIEATRIAPFKPRGIDVSVILDLMIHDIDLVLSIVDSPIAEIDALGAAVSSEHEDIANARLRFENGCVATITASRISLKTERRMRLFSQDGYLSADFMERKLTFIGREKGIILPGTGGFKRESVSWKEHDNLAVEHQAFVASCLEGAPVLVDAQAGIRALDTAIRVTESIKNSRKIMEISGLITP
ncbi:Gfo/Idh/MocA family protein [Swingsia samuiensis]|uniref:Gfo/Idh/MocA family oxidoreductase n=1 Tax=Swingsia samuiensis TaxID=1293412 RepID=A0A4Y6UJX2_9PROT|nr:Gfo/Idh/MocA family oxidoreductase [Swingsia samuiensis]QDH17893.1 Gfo/Idh/MocA family oxidoreductase [Swingsia samuiensis]